MGEDEDVEEGSSESVSDFEDKQQEESKGTKKSKKESKNNDDDYPSELEDSDDEKEDYTIRKSDALIVAATAENDHSNLEVYVYDHQTSDLYVHHEIILASYPLCLEWLPSWGDTEKANMIIVGTFLPAIEVWDLNKEDCEPVFVLGDYNANKSGTDSKKKKKKQGMINQFSKSNNQQFQSNSHTDAVMCLSLNPF